METRHRFYYFLKPNPVNHSLFEGFVIHCYTDTFQKHTSYKDRCSGIVTQGQAEWLVTVGQRGRFEMPLGGLAPKVPEFLFESKTH